MWHATLKPNIPAQKEHWDLLLKNSLNLIDTRTALPIGIAGDDYGKFGPVKDAEPLDSPVLSGLDHSAVVCADTSSS